MRKLIRIPGFDKIFADISNTLLLTLNNRIYFRDFPPRGLGDIFVQAIAA